MVHAVIPNLNMLCVTRGTKMFSHLSLAKQVVPAQAHTTGLANDGINDGNNINLIEFTAIIANTSKCVCNEVCSCTSLKNMQCI